MVGTASARVGRAAGVHWRACGRAVALSPPSGPIRARISRGVGRRAGSLARQSAIRAHTAGSVTASTSGALCTTR